MHDERFASLAERLLRGGVAPRHVRRTIFELQCHSNDLVGEFIAAGDSIEESEARASARLGTDDLLVENILARSELRSWATNWPWVAFGLLPLITLPVFFFGCLFLLAGVFEFAYHALGVLPATSGGLRFVRTIFLAAAVWLSPLVVAGTSCFLAGRQRVPMVWPVIGTIIIGIFGALTNAGLDWPMTAPKGELSAGIGFSTSSVLSPATRTAATLVFVLVPYVWWQRAKENMTLRQVR
jgi:hypothetical protein